MITFDKNITVLRNSVNDNLNTFGNQSIHALVKITLKPWKYSLATQCIRFSRNNVKSSSQNTLLHKHIIKTIPFPEKKTQICN